MDDRSGHADESRPDAPSPQPRTPGTMELYETDDGVVLYDAENPLAWVRTTLSISLEDAN